MSSFGIAVKRAFFTSLHYGRDVKTVAWMRRTRSDVPDLHLAATHTLLKLYWKLR
jgi:hypothetical protein